MSKRTPEEMIAYREEQNRKAKVRLARARDPRIEAMEEIAAGLELIRDLFDDEVIGDVDTTIVALESMIAKLIEEATDDTRRITARAQEKTT